MRNKHNFLKNILINMTTYRNKIIFIFNIFIGLIIISYTIYRRFFIIRLPKSLLLFDNGLNLYLLLLIIISLFFCFYQIIMNILFILNKSEKKSTFLTKILRKLSNLINDAFFDLYTVIYNKTPNAFDKISNFVEEFYALFHKYTEALFIIGLFFIRLVIVICFLIDVFVFFKLYYMYKACYLLCFSLLFKLLFYILKDFANNLENAESLLIIDNLGVDAKTGLPLTNYSLKPEYNDLILSYYVKQYILCLKINGYLNAYENFKTLFTPYIDIIIYSLYLFGWLYVLIINLYN